MGWFAPFIMAVSCRRLPMLSKGSGSASTWDEEPVTVTVIESFTTGTLPVFGSDARRHGLGGGAQRGRDLDQLHGVHRIEEVEADEALGPLRGRGEVGDGQRRRVGGENRLGLQELVELLEVRTLDGQLLDDRLDQQVDAGQVVEMRRPPEAFQEGAHVGRGQLSLLDVLLELLLDLRLLGVERARRRLR
jgi:hypothetical protein